MIRLSDSIVAQLLRGPQSFADEEVEQHDAQPFHPSTPRQPALSYTGTGGSNRGTSGWIPNGADPNGGEAPLMVRTESTAGKISGARVGMRIGTRVVVGGEADSSEVTWDASGDTLVVSGRASVLGEPANAVVVQDGLGGEFVGIDPAGWVIYLVAETNVQPCNLRIYAMDNDTGVLQPIPDATNPGCVAGTSEAAVEPRSG
jgi:hypothetical protein